MGGMTPGTVLFLAITLVLHIGIIEGQTTTVTEAPTTQGATAAPVTDGVTTGVTSASAGSNFTDPSINDANVFSTVTCSSNADCESRANSECDYVILADGTTRSLYCQCNTANGWRKDAGGDKCEYPSKLGEICEESKTVCDTANSECAPDGANTGLLRCKCKVGFVKVTPTGSTDPVCGKILHTRVVPTCGPCEENDGVCYSTTSEDTRSGCLCPTSRTGSDCENIHVNVTCDTKAFQMRICYNPHPGVNFTTGSLMYAIGKGSDEACKGTAVGTNSSSSCPAGNYELVLPLAKAELDRCGTKEYMSTITTRKFESKIVVQKDPLQSQLSDPIFDVFCSFRTNLDLVYGGIGVVGTGDNGLPGNDRGEHKEAEITLQVKNHLNDILSPNQPILLGDKIKLEMFLKADGTYSAMRVERCTASSSPSIPDPKASTMQLFRDGCPYSGQSIFKSSNSWSLTSGLPNSLQTGLFYMFRMSKGSTVHIHCTVKLCLVSDEASCALQTCPASRRKRDIEEKPTDDDLTLGGSFNDSPANTEDTTDVATTLMWYNKESLKQVQKEQGLVAMEEVGFAVLILVLVALVVMFVVLSIYFYSKSRNTPAKEIDLGFNKPQRFALPRIGRTNQRV